MKIGILTMDYAKNYGGILQTYGIFKFLESQGHEVEIINYKNSCRNSFRSLLSKLERRITAGKKSVDSNIPTRKLTSEYLQNFKDFRSVHLKYTQKVDEKTIAKTCSKFDAVIVGSDQIWNDVYTNRLVYYFDWNYSGKKIAYAACTILANCPKAMSGKIKSLLKSFDTITVRDNHTADFVVRNIKTRPRIVVDPSCLHDYNEFIGDNPIGKPYILTYILSDEIAGTNHKAIEIIKKNVGDLPVVSLCIPSVSVVSQSISDFFLEDATPIDWVNLFYHASFVFTDSFHGIMFSMKYKKPFIAYMKDGQRKSRLQDLVDRLQLKNIAVNADQIQSIFDEDSINYPQVNAKLEALRTESIQLLNQAINV